MPFTLVRGKQVLSAPVKMTVIQATFDNSYLTGGELFDADDFVRGDTVLVVFIPPKDGYVFEYDISAKTIVARVSGTTGAPLDDEGSATDLSVTPGQIDVLIFHFGG